MRGMHVNVIHVDRHSVVVIPHAAVRQIPAAIELLARREKVILDICKDLEFTVVKLHKAIARMDEIHDG